jgi:hypothetical protein
LLGKTRARLLIQSGDDLGQGAEGFIGGTKKGVSLELG